MKMILSLAVAVVLLCGCGRNDGPAVNLVTLHFKEATVMETTTDFVLRLSNDSPAAQKFTGSAHKIFINGLYVGKGLSADAIEVPRLGTVTQAVTVHLSNLALATRIKAVIEAKSFDYKVQSVFFGDSVFSRTRSETSGKLDLKDFTPTETNAPPVRPQSPVSAVAPIMPPESPAPANP